LLELTGIKKRWPTGETILDGVDLTIPPGAVVSVAGGNGAGKTTLLRIAAGIILPDTGLVDLDGVPIERDLSRFRRSIGFLSAGDRGLYARLSVRRNLDVWSGMAGLLSRERRSQIAQAIENFEIAEFADRRADRLSLGQRQRARLAMTFVHRPRIVLLDEPRTSLDDAGIAVLERVLDDLTQRGGCALWASPEKDEPLATHRWLLQDGALQSVADHTGHKGVETERDTGRTSPLVQ
jgi:ABC-2 type transport system ATP-binding protein